MKVKTVKHKNITRIDHPAKKTHGYMVRIQWKGERSAKFFSDKKHGDRLAALSAAIEWRNHTEQQMGKPRTERLVVGMTRSQIGVPGVRRRREGGNEYYEATWVSTIGKLHRTRFSITRHGERRALSLARKTRQYRERERYRTPAYNRD